MSKRQGEVLEAPPAKRLYQSPPGRSLNDCLVNDAAYILGKGNLDQIDVTVVTNAKGALTLAFKRGPRINNHIQLPFAPLVGKTFMHPLGTMNDEETKARIAVNDKAPDEPCNHMFKAAVGQRRWTDHEFKGGEEGDAAVETDPYMIAAFDKLRALNDRCIAAAIQGGMYADKVSTEKSLWAQIFRTKEERAANPIWPWMVQRFKDALAVRPFLSGMKKAEGGEGGEDVEGGDGADDGVGDGGEVYEKTPEELAADKAEQRKSELSAVLFTSTPIFYKLKPDTPDWGRKPSKTARGNSALMQMHEDGRQYHEVPVIDRTSNTPLDLCQETVTTGSVVSLVVKPRWTEMVGVGGLKLEIVKVNVMGSLKIVLEHAAEVGATIGAEFGIAPAVQSGNGNVF